MPNDSRPVVKLIREKAVKDHVKKLLRAHECYFFMPVQSGYGSTTLDILGCHKGRFFSVETKAPGKVPSPRQELVMEVMNEAGAAVFVVGEHAIYKEDKLKIDTYSGMAGLEAWLLLGP